MALETVVAQYCADDLIREVVMEIRRTPFAIALVAASLTVLAACSDDEAAPPTDAPVDQSAPATTAPQSSAPPATSTPPETMPPPVEETSPPAGSGTSTVPDTSTSPSS